MSEIEFKITNLTCEACVKLSIKVLKKIPGVSDAVIDLSTGLAKVQADQAVLWEDIEAMLVSVDRKAIRLNQ